MDSLDLDIFLFFLNNCSMTHTVVDVVKVLKNPQNRAKLIKYTSKFTYRLKKWTEKGFFIKEKRDNKNYYTINMKSIYYKNIKLLSEEIKKALIFEMDDNTFVVHFV